MDTSNNITGLDQLSTSPLAHCFLPDKRSIFASKVQRSEEFSYSLDTVAQNDIRDVSPSVFTKYFERQFKKSQRLKERDEIKQAFVKRLRQFGFKREADDLKRCSSEVRVLACKNNHSFRAIVNFRCHLPFCPDCWETKSHRELKRNLPKFLQVLKDDPSLIVAFSTLTLKSDQSRSLTRGCKQLKKNFKDLRRLSVWRNCVGGFGRIENTFSSEHGWHPHLHSIVLLKDYIPQAALSSNWKKITGDSPIVDIRQVHDVANALVEAIKYPFKPTDLKELGKLEIDQMLNSRGERLGMSFGCLFGVQADDDIEEVLDSDYAQFVKETNSLTVGECCPVCRGKLDFVHFSKKDYITFLSSTTKHFVSRRC